MKRTDGAVYLLSLALAVGVTIRMRNTVEVVASWLCKLVLSYPLSLT